MASVDSVPIDAVVAADERRHRPRLGSLWSESWAFDFATGDASLGGFVRLGMHPDRGVAWYWAALVGRGRRLVLVRDTGVDLPRGASLEVRGQGLWSAITCESPLEHWSVGLEAFAVAFDDPAEAYRSERGDLVGLGFDLEWEALAPPHRRPPGDGYGQACRVSGEVLIGDEQLLVDAVGYRHHDWGPDDWWASPGWRASGFWEDGSFFAAWRWPDGRGGAALGAGAAPAAAAASGSSDGRNGSCEGPVDISVTTDAKGLLAAASVTMGPWSVQATPLAAAPLLVDVPTDGGSRLRSALCSFQRHDGCRGAGWVSGVEPAG
ncbi:MAG TPA: hypothetical protein VHT30_08310 [Acidimicrobiales bacterium]|jgi:hypothetical protein|nr:hypothetical protein [Acidimicrobiales bacterium]